MTEKPLNALIAEALGWRTWEDMRPGREGEWFQERDGEPGRIEVARLTDYLSLLRQMPAALANQQQPPPPRHRI